MRHSMELAARQLIDGESLRRTPKALVLAGLCQLLDSGVVVANIRTP